MDAKVITMNTATDDNINSSLATKTGEEDHCKSTQKELWGRRRRSGKERRKISELSSDSGRPMPRDLGAKEETGSESATINLRVRNKLGRQDRTPKMKWDMGRRPRKEKYRQRDVTGDYEAGSKPSFGLTCKSEVEVLQQPHSDNYVPVSITRRNERQRDEKDRALQRGMGPSVRPTLTSAKHSSSKSAKANRESSKERETDSFISDREDKPKMSETEGVRSSTADRGKGDNEHSKTKLFKTLGVWCKSGPDSNQEDYGKMERKVALWEHKFEGLDTWVRLAIQQSDKLGMSPWVTGQFGAWEEVRLTTLWDAGVTDNIVATETLPGHSCIRDGYPNVTSGKFGREEKVLVEVNSAAV